MSRPFKTCTIFFLVSCLSGCATSRPPAHQTEKAEKPPEQQVVTYAMNLIGTPYRYGGKTPTAGLDCSGLVSHVFNKIGMPLVGTAADIASQGKEIAQSALRAGDLVFFNTRQRPLSHVGIYIGNGRFVHAPGTGNRIRISSLKNAYFARRFDTARTYIASADTGSSHEQIMQ